MISERTFDLQGSALPAGAAEPAPSAENRGTFEERLDRILERTTDLVARVGYERASMRQVAQATGVSLAGLYHYFDSKEKMLFLIQFRTFNALLNHLREKLHGIDDPLEQLHVMVRNHTNYFVANIAALKVCSHELDSLAGEAYAETLAVRRQYYELTRGIIDRIFEKHAPDSPFDRHIATMSLFGTLNWLYRWYDPKRGRSPNVLANQITTQFLRGILGPATETDTKAAR